MWMNLVFSECFAQLTIAYISSTISSYKRIIGVRRTIPEESFVWIAVGWREGEPLEGDPKR